MAFYQSPVSDEAMRKLVGQLLVNACKHASTVENLLCARGLLCWLHGLCLAPGSATDIEVSRRN